MRVLFALTLVVISQASFARPTTNKISNPDNWMVIIGDSGSTGAASNKNLKANASSILGNTIGTFISPKTSAPPPPLADFPNPERFKIDKIEPMTRIFFSPEEYADAKKAGGILDLLNNAKGSLAVDVQEHSNGYMIGRALGIASQDIVLVGQDGVRVNSIAKQFSRIYAMKTKTLPPLVLMSFTANDFCSPLIFTDPFEQLHRNFEQSLAEAWKKSEPYLHAHAKGTRIVVLAALEVANVLTNESIMRQKITFEGEGEITCGEVRRGETNKTPLSRLLSDKLAGMCRSVLATRPSDTARLQRLRDIQNDFNEVWKKQIAELNEKYRADKIEWTYVEGVRQVQFEEGDIANDCFHPGVGAHAKLADYVLKNVFGM